MKKGFTLIELLIVIAIIALLAGIVLASFTSSRVKARDARRVSDIGQIQVALESYFRDYTASHNNIYPAALSSLPPTYISVLPTDPKSQASYGYFLNTDNQSYCVGANLENANAEAITKNTSCNGISWCTLTTTSDGKTINYKVCRQ